MLLLIFTPFPAYIPSGSEVVATAYSINDMTIPAGVLASLRDKQFQDQLSEPGAGQITFQNDDADLALINPPFTVIRFDVQGWPAWTMICETFTAQTVAQGELGDETTEWSGRGHMAILERGVIYPSGGTGRLPVQDDRSFNWSSPEYDDSLWTQAKEVLVASVAKQELLLSGTGWLVAIDQDYPDNTAFMIWATSGSFFDAPSGYCYFRRTFTIPTTGRYLIYWLTDNAGSLYVDGLHLEDSTAFIKFSNVFVDLTAGDHTFAASVLNYFVTPPGPGGFLFSLYTTDESGGAATLIMNSNSAWKILGYPAQLPGMTPGEAIRICVDEWQARGGLAGVVLNFSDELDSAGQSWPEVDLATKVGTDILTFCREMADTYCDIWMDPVGLFLNAWNYGTRGQLQAIVYEPPTDPEDPNSGNLTALTHRGQI